VAVDCEGSCCWCPFGLLPVLELAPGSVSHTHSSNRNAGLPHPALGASGILSRGVSTGGLGGALTTLVRCSAHHFTSPGAANAHELKDLRRLRTLDWGRLLAAV
jgi:hypothetical protein